MLCKKPFGYFGCGQCLPCRINRRNLWTGRMLLELTQHAAASFITLTYQDKFLPEVWNARDWNLFAKRLTYFAGPYRFYAVGERGSINGRPHWHAALFGIGIERAEEVIRAWRGHPAGLRVVPESSVGGVHIGELNHDSAQYLCKYMCKPDDRPIVRMSRRPCGIGAKATESIAGGLLAYGGSAALASVGDVPREMRVGGRKYPLGKYLRGKLREACGWDCSTPVEVRRAYARERSSETPEDMRLRARRRQAAALNAEGRLRIKKSKEKL